MPDYQIAVALPVLARASREWGPNPELDVIIGELSLIAQRRGLHRVLAQIERQARGEEMMVAPRNGNGPTEADPHPAVKAPAKSLPAEEPREQKKKSRQADSEGGD